MDPRIEPGLLPEDLADKVKDWWCVSRRQKWGRKAVWSERAFRKSLARVVALARVNPARANYLCERGLEMGWQALDPQFVENDRAYQAIGTPANPADRRPLTDPSRVVTAAEAMRDWPEESAPDRRALPWGVNRTGPAVPEIEMSKSAKNFAAQNPGAAELAKTEIKKLFSFPSQ